MADKTKSEVIEAVFDYWRTILAHPRARLDAKRAAAIGAMLDCGYEENDLKLAVYGCKYSPFHQGANERNTMYDAVTLIFRNADNVDKFIAIGEARRNLMLARQKQKAELAPAANQVADTGVYQANRETLLRLVRKTG